MTTNQQQRRGESRVPRMYFTITARMYSLSEGSKARHRFDPAHAQYNGFPRQYVSRGFTTMPWHARNHPHAVCTQIVVLSLSLPLSVSCVLPIRLFRSSCCPVNRRAPIILEYTTPYLSLLCLFLGRERLRFGWSAPTPRRPCVQWTTAVTSSG